MGCRSIAFTYNDPVIFHEYAIDVAQACHAYGINTVAVSAGYVCDAPRQEFYKHMDAANIDLKAFTQRFYNYLTGANLEPVLDTLKYLKHETDVWFEITTLLIPGGNDSSQEIESMTDCIMENLGSDVPLHFSAFHPDWKMRDKPNTPPSTLTHARQIAIQNGLKYVYTGNVHNKEGDTTFCAGCNAPVIERDWYVLKGWALEGKGKCQHCGTVCPGVFEDKPGNWGAKRMPVRLS